MKSYVLSSCFEPLHIYMESCTLNPPRCFLHAKPVQITRDLFDLFSNMRMMVKAKWPSLCSYEFLAMLHEEDGCSNE